MTAVHSFLHSSLYTTGMSHLKISKRFKLQLHFQSVFTFIKFLKFYIFNWWGLMYVTDYPVSRFIKSC